MSGKTVVFDLDGVLLHGDSTVELLRRRLRHSPWLLPPVAVAGALFALSDRRSRWRSRWSRAVVAAALLGRRIDSVEAELRALAEDLHAQEGLAPTRTVEALRSHVAQGDRVLVSSAGLEPFVHAWVDLLTEPGAVTAAGSRLAQHRSGVVLADHHYGGRKVERAAELGFAPPYDVVYSDSDSDLPLLECATTPVLVEPSDRTLDALPRAVRERAQIWR
ncbi:haloacid dehalogenase-like hydrolase [Aeromicrobium wangtongii]|uniref:haloacid dehalogenase-like hydrolase n=1 Tax=Aeromicrobium wangtongii TaxID=2969247 RepID=UPI0020172631|nr:haloacid dehalogenase-like hydrolase [Aeromicrobium wangtongii]MCL3817900.1 haloacid dehalogenase-like hydrolase [Aeromicrobium wangtongii]